MFTPHFIYERIITAPQKQLMAVIVGGIVGIMCLIGEAKQQKRRGQRFQRLSR